MVTPSPVDRLPKVGEVWRLAATIYYPAGEARIDDVSPGPNGWVRVLSAGQDRIISMPVFRASARFLREKTKERN